MNQGWIRIHRQIFSNELWFSERFTKSQAWIDLILLANHIPKTFFLRGIEIKLNRGQLSYSIVSLAERWQWNERTVDKFLKWLEIRKMIHSKKNNITTIISIIKYDEYQNVTEQNTEQNTERVQSNVQTNKNVKNVKNTITRDSECKIYIDKWNQVFNRKFKNYKILNSLMDHWLNIYTIDEILIAVDRLKKDEYWGDKGTDPVWLLRTKDTNQQPVDYIGRMLNNKPKKGNTSEQMMEAYGL